ncbi:hypothetical protein LUZ60_012139 [Juncus effusus]|nr:hypothetical protein LUZ60_012139 [Juncus effusus]
MPVHMAAIKGRVVIVTELTKDCEAATHEHSHRGETILHLAVRANSLETVKFLMSRMVNDIIINAKDERGNTALHLAVASKNLTMIKLLLSNKEIVINSTNTRGFTPLDVLLESRQEYGDLIIGETIRAAGGKTTTELAPSQQFVIPDSILENKLVKIESEKSNRIQDHSDTNTIKGVEKSILELKKLANGKSQNPDIVLLTATLVATITFQAGLTPPGGFESTTDDKKIWKGEAVLDDNLDIFLVFDMIGLYSAVSVILLFLSLLPQRSKTLMKLLVCVTWI